MAVRENRDNAMNARRWACHPLGTGPPERKASGPGQGGELLNNQPSTSGAEIEADLSERGLVGGLIHRGGGAVGEQRESRLHRGRGGGQEGLELEGLGRGG